MTDSGGGTPRSGDDAAQPRRGDRDADFPAPGTDPGASADDPPAAGDGRPTTDDGRSADGGDRSDAPPTRGRPRREVPAPTERPVRWYLRSEHPVVVATRDVATSALLVAMIGLALFAVSGVWPPLVAIESGSMEPHMSQGDLVVVIEEDRFGSQVADDHGIVTRSEAAGTGHTQFGAPGNVIVFRPDGTERTPIIHRAAFYVEAGENWVQRADPEYLRGQDCADLATCPADHAGYITRGDANGGYDQVDEQSDVVRPSWIEGRAAAGVPYLGCIRLELSGGPSCFEENRRVAG